MPLIIFVPTMISLVTAGLFWSEVSDIEDYVEAMKTAWILRFIVLLVLCSGAAAGITWAVMKYL